LVGTFPIVNVEQNTVSVNLFVDLSVSLVIYVASILIVWWPIDCFLSHSWTYTRSWMSPLVITHVSWEPEIVGREAVT